MRKKRISVKQQKKMELQDRVMDSLEKDGVNLFGNDNVDDAYLQLPFDLTEEDSRELGRYFNAFTQQKMYLRGIIARLNAVIRGIASDLTTIRSDVYRELPERTSVKEKELYFSASDEARDKVKELEFYEEKLGVAEAYIESLEDAITLVSREISRRESDWNHSVREENLEKKRR